MAIIIMAMEIMRQAITIISTMRIVMVVEIMLTTGIMGMVVMGIMLMNKVLSEH